MGCGRVDCEKCNVVELEQFDRNSQKNFLDFGKSIQKVTPIFGNKRGTTLGLIYSGRSDSCISLYKFTKTTSTTPLSPKGLVPIKRCSVDIIQYIQKSKILSNTRYKEIILNVELIKIGHLGTIKKVRDNITNELKVMKVIPIVNMKRSYSNLLDEIDILSTLDHPNIIKLFEFSKDSENFFIITEFCEGGELFEKLLQMKTFPEEKAARIMKSILSAVSYCHANHIAHRDIKPENLLLDTTRDDAIVKLMLLLRTTYYVAPEVLRKCYNEKCDIWSCGVILYIMLCGYPPFNGRTTDQILDKIKTGKFSLAKRGWEDISKEAKSLIKKMLEFCPEKRISAEDALNHPWIQNLGKLSVIDITDRYSFDVLKNLQAFQMQTKFQTIVIAFIANYVQSQRIRTQLSREFELLDINGDGKLQKSELIAGYRSSGKSLEEASQIVDNIMEKIDVNKNGLIDFSEFLTANLDKEIALADISLHEAFCLFDKDQNGQITIDELEEVLGTGQEDIETISDILKEIDTNGDGKISFSEFKDMMFKLCYEFLLKKSEIQYNEFKNEL